MKKILLCIGVLITPFLGFNTHPEDLSENNAQIVALLGDQLTKHPEWLDEINRKMENFDLSGREIGPVDFNGWSLVNIDFSNTDLSETQLYKAKSEGVKLGGAILCKGVRLGKKISDSRLVKLYSRFIKDGEMEKAEALNNIIGFLNVSLKGKDVSDLDITGIYVNFDLSPQLVDQSLHNAGSSTRTNLSNTNLSCAISPDHIAINVRDNLINDSSERKALLSSYNKYIMAQEKSRTIKKIKGGLIIGVSCVPAIVLFPLIFVEKDPYLVATYCVLDLCAIFFPMVGCAIVNSNDYCN